MYTSPVAPLRASCLGEDEEPASEDCPLQERRGKNKKKIVKKRKEPKKQKKETNKQLDRGAGRGKCPGGLKKMQTARSGIRVWGGKHVKVAR